MTTSSSGVKFDFDEDESLEPSAIITHDRLTRQSTRSNGMWFVNVRKRYIILCINIFADFGSSRGAPSIGEVSVVSSTIGEIRPRGSSPDRESASIAALAGASLTGSVGSSSHPPSHNK